MRIVSKDEKERITQCKCCSSKIAYKMEDVFFGLWNEKQIKCPVCGEIFKISIFDKKI